jgi:hypothetical protein
MSPPSNKASRLPGMPSADLAPLGVNYKEKKLGRVKESPERAGFE